MRGALFADAGNIFLMEMLRLCRRFFQNSKIRCFDIIEARIRSIDLLK